MEQTTGVGMRRGPKDIALRPKFYEASRVHDGDAVSDLRDYREVVRDEEHGETELGAKFAEQFQNLGLDGDVERGRGLVCNQ